MNGSWVYTHFTTGLVSDEIHGRYDAKWYYSALQTADNCIITPFGNIKKRNGTKYILSMDIDDVVLLPFVYNENDCYVIALTRKDGAYTCYFFTNDGIVLDSSGNEYSVSLPITNTTIPLNEIQYIQKDDIFYLVHKDFDSIIKLTRLAPDNWSVSSVSFDLQYVVDYGDGTTKKAQAYLPYFFFNSNFKMYFNYTIGGTEYTTEVGSNTNHITNTITDAGTSKVYFEVDTAFDAGTPIKVILKDSAGNDINWKANALAFFENRLILGGLYFGSVQFPQTLMASVVGNYEVFVFGDQDNLSWMFEIASQENNEIVWITAKGNLMVGTIGGEYVVYGGANGITYDSVSVVKQSSYGSAKVQPVIIENMPIFVQSKKQQLYGFIFNYNINSYKGLDLNLLNKTILNSGVKQLAVEVSPYARLWALLNDGKIAQLSFLQNEGVMAWSRFYSGLDDKNYDEVISIASVPAQDGNYTKIYLVFKRFGKFSFEVLTNPHYDDYFDTFFTDCSTVYNGDLTNSIAVPYPDGTTVSIFTQQGLHPDVNVLGNAVALNWNTTKAYIGLPYKFEIATMPFELIDLPQFISINKPKSIRNIVIQLDKTIGGEFGINGEYQFIYRKPSDLMDNPVPLYTGYRNIILYNSDLQTVKLYINLRQMDALPFDVLSIGFDFYIGDL